MEELKRLQENIEKIIEAVYDDGLIEDMVAESLSVRDLNEALEDELSYAAEAMED